MSDATPGDFGQSGNILRPKAFERDSSTSAAPLSGAGDGGGTMLEARVASLESDVAHLQRDVASIQADMKTVLAGIADLRKDVATILANSGHLATREWTLRQIFYAGVFLCGLAVAAAGYAPRLQVLLGTAPVPAAGTLTPPR